MTKKDRRNGKLSNLLFSSSYSDILIGPSPPEHYGGYHAHLNILSLRTTFFTKNVTEHKAKGPKRDFRTLSRPISPRNDPKPHRAKEKNTGQDKNRPIIVKVEDNSSEDSDHESRPQRTTHKPQGSRLRKLEIFDSCDHDNITVFNFAHHSVETVCRVLTWVYTDNYHITYDGDEPAETAAVEHFRVYDLADFMEMPRLKRSVYKRLRSLLKLSEISDYQSIASGGEYPEITDAMVKQVKNLIKVVWGEPEPERDAWKSVKELVQLAAVWMIIWAPRVTWEMEEVFREFPEFHMPLLQEYVVKMHWCLQYKKLVNKMAKQPIESPEEKEEEEEEEAEKSDSD
ncbi:hypothetical protein EX30DRAFT_398691 [Ascodesmis nigricans]|uniref:BTB domain-containing protein n=1 Tax=Ascodesmis nigricans TaxID=341454 RepID=A0A4V3SHR9_9PEZI|nr:hypothetical protein EX30DRAFT_398691 [Ascodesmis nigricans]